MSDTKNALERYIAAKLERIYKYSRPTLASGATPVEKGDVKNPYFAIEAKIRNTKSFTFDSKVWKEIGYIAAREQKDPVYVIQNIEKQRIAIMDFEDWCNLLYELFELREKYQ